MTEKEYIAVTDRIKLNMALSCISNTVGELPDNVLDAIHILYEYRDSLPDFEVKE